MNAILYTTGCPRCKVLREKLDGKGIPYTVNDSVDEMLSLGITEVPVLSVDGELLPFAEAMARIQSLKTEV